MQASTPYPNLLQRPQFNIECSALISLCFHLPKQAFLMPCAVRRIFLDRICRLNLCKNFGQTSTPFSISHRTLWRYIRFVCKSPYIQDIFHAFYCALLVCRDSAIDQKVYFHCMQHIRLLTLFSLFYLAFNCSFSAFIFSASSHVLDI